MKKLQSINPQMNDDNVKYPRFHPWVFDEWTWHKRHGDENHLVVKFVYGKVFSDVSFVNSVVSKPCRSRSAKRIDFARPLMLLQSKNIDIIMPFVYADDYGIFRHAEPDAILKYGGADAVGAFAQHYDVFGNGCPLYTDLQDMRRHSYDVHGVSFSDMNNAYDDDVDRTAVVVHID